MLLIFTLRSLYLLSSIALGNVFHTTAHLLVGWNDVISLSRLPTFGVNLGKMLGVLLMFLFKLINTIQYKVGHLKRRQNVLLKCSHLLVKLMILVTDLLYLQHLCSSFASCIVQCNIM